MRQFQDLVDDRTCRGRTAFKRFAQAFGVQNALSAVAYNCACTFNLESPALVTFLKHLLLAITVSVMLVVSAWAISLQEAAERVARQHNAKVVSAHTIERDGRRVHVIRILTEDGVVRTVRVPADRR